MIAFLCICHRGEIELKTAFLIYTLNKYLQIPYKIYVAIPEDSEYLEAPSDTSYNFLGASNVRLIYFRNPLLKLRNTTIKGDRTSNKVFALAYPFPEEVVVFLDSDIALMQSSDFMIFNSSLADIMLKPANRANVKSWEKIFAAAGQQVPKTRILTSIDNIEIPPYYNSGVMGISKSIRNQFQQVWLEYTEWLWNPEIHLSLDFPPFHRDQVALSLTINKLNANILHLPEKYNFPLRGKKFNSRTLPVFVHYHHPYAICSNSLLNNEFVQFLRQTPDIQKLVAQHEKWKNLFAAGKLMKTYYFNLEKIRNWKSLIKRKLTRSFRTKFISSSQPKTNTSSI